MKRNYWILVIALILAVLALLPACAKTSMTTTGATTSKPATTTTSAKPTTVTPKSGGTLRIGVAFDAVAIGEPSFGKADTDSLLSCPAIEQMCKIDANGAMTPWLLDSYKIDAKALTIDVAVKKGIRFSDGTTFDADALIWNYKLEQDNKIARVAPITTIDKIDDYNIKIHINAYDADVDYNLLRLYIVSPTAWKANGKDWGIQNPVGTGPFKMVSHQPDASIKFVKNTDYWQKGKPYLDEIDFTIIKDDATRLASFQAGETDISLDPTIAQAQDIKKNPQYVLVDDPGVGSYRLGPDGNNPDTPTYKKEVRQAVAYAIDRQGIIDGVFGGYGVVATQWNPQGTWAYNPNLKGYSYDPEKAKQLLATAGYPNGVKTSLIGSSANPFALVLQAIQGSLAKANITADLNLMAPAALDATWKGGWKNGFGIRQLPPTPFMISWSSSYVIYSNRSTWVSLLNAQDIDDAAHAANAAPDLATRQPLVWKLWDLLYYQDVQQIPLFITDALCVKYPYVKGEGLYTLILNGEWHPEDGWLNK